QVFTYEGRCERYELDPEGRGVRLEADSQLQQQLSGPGPAGAPAAPWLRPTEGSFNVPVERFRLHCFVPPDQEQEEEEEERGGGQQEGGEEVQAVLPPAPALPRVYGKLELQLLGPLYRWWEPLYSRLHVQLCLTPLPADAGADLTLLYPADPLCSGLAADQAAAGLQGLGALPQQGVLDGLDASEVGWELLGPESLPPGRPLWPAPDPGAVPVSPFSGGSRDYLRAAGPGVYVGCAYVEGPREGELREENFVYFVIVRKV
ncbi:hypothetical protein Agub_g4237, partial [Astrephomene gubernaculifera]